jgi:hypothetical protein
VRGVKTSGNLTLQLQLLRPGATPGPCTPGNPAITGEVTCVLNASGAHTFQASGFVGQGTGDYSFHLQRLNNPVGCTAINYMTAVLDSITAPADVDCFTFTGAPGSQVRITESETSGDLTTIIELLRPDGQAQTGCDGSNSAITGQVTCTLTHAGTHTILAYDFGGTHTGGYTLTLLCLAGPCTSAGPTATSTSLPTATATTPPSATPTATTVVSTATRTPTATTGTAPAVGGRDFRIQTSSGSSGQAGTGLSIRLDWTDGTTETRYSLMRLRALEGITTYIDLGPTASSYVDTEIPTPGGLYCYVLLVFQDNTLLGFTDMLCASPGYSTGISSSSGSHAPQPTISPDRLRSSLERAR